MRQRLARALLAGVVFTTLLIPAAGGIAGPHDELRAKEDRLESIRQRIEESERDKTSLKENIDVLNKAITDLQIEINKLDSRISGVESEVRAEETKIAKTQSQIDAIQDLATEQAVALYMAGATETIDALLSIESLSELDNRVQMLGVAARENTDALVKFHRLKLTIQAQRLRLFNKQEELEAIRKERTKALTTRSDLRRKLAADLAELKSSLEHKHHREKILEDDIAQLTGTIRELQAKRAAESLGISDQGFIWPLNGGVTSGYGPRWGRMHTGIDIDGYSGQPIVASKAGVVIMAKSYSGYGNTVIIDHGGGFATLYAHMSGFAVSNGERVDEGDAVGYVGCTGSCTGDHLHFEVRINGSPVDPLDYLP